MLDELERVRAYRDDMPEPDAATALAARAELLEAIREEPRTDRTSEAAEDSSAGDGSPSPVASRPPESPSLACSDSTPPPPHSRRWPGR